MRYTNPRLLYFTLLSPVFFTDMAYYRGAVLRYRLFSVPRKMKKKYKKKEKKKKKNDKLEPKTKLHGEEEKLHGVLKTAEALVSEADDKLKKSVIQKDIEQVSVAQAMLEAARQKMTQANQSLSEVRRKRDSIAAVGY